MADDKSQRQFLELHLAHHKALFAYLLAGSRDYARAEDLLQKVTLAAEPWEAGGGDVAGASKTRVFG